MKRAFIIRQSAVFPEDKYDMGKWREIYFLEWCIKSGYEVTFIASNFDHYSKSHREENKVDYKGAKRYLLKSPGYSKNISLMRMFDAAVFSIKLFFRLRKLDVASGDVVICAYPTPESAFATAIFLAQKDIRFFVDLRDAWPSIFSSSGPAGKIVTSFYNFLNSFTFRRVDSFISMSQALVDKVIPGKNNYLILPSPKPQLAISQEQYQKIDVLTDGQKFLLFVGTLNEQFDFDIILQACPYIQAEGYKVIIAGDGALKSKLEQQFSLYPCVEFTGRLSNELCRALMNTASGLFCFYKKVEFQGHITNKVIEYAMSDAPIYHNMGEYFRVGRNEYKLGDNLCSGEELIDLIKTNSVHCDDRKVFTNDLSEKNLGESFINYIGAE